MLSRSMLNGETNDALRVVYDYLVDVRCCRFLFVVRCFVLRLRCAALALRRCLRCCLLRCLKCVRQATYTEQNHGMKEPFKWQKARA